MAHFAEIKQEADPRDSSITQWIVKQVIVVGNGTPTAAGPLGENNMHVDGETYCKSLFARETIWKQCSYNTRDGKHYTVNESDQMVLSDDQSQAFRGWYPGVGDYYDPALDRFIPSTPQYPSWVYDDSTLKYEAPTPYPSIASGGRTYIDDDANATECYCPYDWNEAEGRWEGYHKYSSQASSVKGYWDPNTSSWVQI